MNKKEAYRIVFNDILNSGIDLFIGKYDAKHGSQKFMFGISTVMEHLAFNTSEQDYEEFSELFLRNMLDSKKNK